MYNLLIVDDESYILSGLTYNISWEDLDIQEVFKAADARTALMIFQQHRIDLLITDIKMPGESGLALSETILRQWPYTKIIFLTGYRNFEYVQRAVNIRPFAYLLKPISYDELKETARKALEELAAEFMQRSVIHLAQADLSKINDQIQERFFVRWLERNEITPGTEEQTAAPYNIDLRQSDLGFWVAVRTGLQYLPAKPVANQAPESLSEFLSPNPVVNPSMHAAGLAAGQSDLMLLALPDLARSLLAEDQRFYAYLNDHDTYFFLWLSSSADDMQQFFQRTIEKLEMFLYAVQNNTRTKASITWTYPVAVGALRQQYRVLNWQIERSGQQAAGLVRGMDEPREMAAYQIWESLHQRPSLAWLIEHQNYLETARRIRQIQAGLSEQHYPYEQVLEFYHLFIGALVNDSLERKIPIQTWSGSLGNLFESAEAILQGPGFFNQCQSLLKQYADCVSKIQEGDGSKLVHRIYQIVDEQLSGDLSVGKIARLCHYNPSYLSRTFKDQTGISLQDYIIQSRIKTAKKLLDKGEKISDVSLAVGYESLPHFSRCFKRLVGVSPKQYQIGSAPAASAPEGT